jgi:hypothetical protein
MRFGGRIHAGDERRHSRQPDRLRDMTQAGYAAMHAYRRQRGKAVDRNRGKRRTLPAVSTWIELKSRAHQKTCRFLPARGSGKVSTRRFAQCPAVDGDAGCSDVPLLAGGGVAGLIALCEGDGLLGLFAVAGAAGAAAVDGLLGLPVPLLPLGLLLHPPTAKPIQAAAIPSAVRFMIFS